MTLLRKFSKRKRPWWQKIAVRMWQITTAPNRPKCAKRQCRWWYGCFSKTFYQYLSSISVFINRASKAIFKMSKTNQFWGVSSGCIRTHILEKPAYSGENKLGLIDWCCFDPEASTHSHIKWCTWAAATRAQAKRRQSVAGANSAARLLHAVSVNFYHVPIEENKDGPFLAEFETSRASVAQLVRARDCQSLGRRFDSV